jgi:hypothetical protein
MRAPISGKPKFGLFFLPRRHRNAPYRLLTIPLKNATRIEVVQINPRLIRSKIYFFLAFAFLPFFTALQAYTGAQGGGQYAGAQYTGAQ